MARYLDHSARSHNEPSGDRKAESDTSAAQNESAQNIDKIATLLQVKSRATRHLHETKCGNIDKIATLLPVREQGIASTRSTLQDIEVN